jgi:hypothetical protein
MAHLPGLNLLLPAGNAGGPLTARGALRDPPVGARSKHEPLDPAHPSRAPPQVMVVRLRRNPVTPPAPGLDARQTHQTGDPLAAEALTARPQLAVNPRTAIARLGRRVNRADLHQQTSILTLPLALGTAAPRIKSTRRNRQHTAQHPQRIVRLLRLDKSVPHSDSLAKKAVAFFKVCSYFCFDLAFQALIAGMPS